MILPLKCSSSATIIVAVLDWGLGHATRCIPIIQSLDSAGYQVLIASAGDSLSLLQKEFPCHHFITLPAYNIVYPSSNMILNMSWQLPKIALTIMQEHWAIRKAVQKYKVDIIIADNRFGCFSSSAHNIFITHQTYIKTRLQWLSKLVNIANHACIRRYDEVWIPDHQDQRLSGELSSPIPNMLNRYIGPLSRMSSTPDTPINYRWIAILSGPEPQRTYWQQKIITQANQYKHKTLLIEGKVKQAYKHTVSDYVDVVSYMQAQELQQSIAQAQAVICRAGYSSIMDLAVLGKKALLVPTPGQTEQEYLAQYLANKDTFVCQIQEDFDLQIAWTKLQLTTS